MTVLALHVLRLNLEGILVFLHAFSAPILQILLTPPLKYILRSTTVSQLHHYHPGPDSSPVVLSHFSCVRRYATPWTVAHQAPPSMGILQAGLLEQVVMASSRGSSQPRDQTWVSCLGSTTPCYIDCSSPAAPALDSLRASHEVLPDLGHCCSSRLSSTVTASVSELYFHTLPSLS